LFPLLYFDITFYNFYTQSDRKVEETVLLGALLRILVLSISKQENLVTIKENLHLCNGPRIQIPYIALCNIIKIMYFYIYNIKNVAELLHSLTFVYKMSAVNIKLVLAM